jgi:hypothetical protein
MSKRHGNIDHYITFSLIWNDTNTFTDLEAIAAELGLTVQAVKSKAKRYRQTKRMYPEIGLPPILDRNKKEMDFYDDGIEVPDFVLPDAKKYVITSAQYGAAVNDGFLSSLFYYCQDTGAELVVMPIKYGVTLSPISPKLDGFVTYRNQRLHEHLELNTLNLRPTLVEPLTSLEKHGGLRSQIFAHPKVSLKMVATSSHDTCKATMTTGAVTHPEYKPDKTGRVAERDHSYGAVVVELDGDAFHYRHIEADNDDSFYDMCTLYTPDGVQRSHRPLALVCGDWHIGYTCTLVREATYGSSGIVDSLRPEAIFKHDYFDGRSISHHDEKDNIYMAHKAAQGQLSLQEELRACADEAKELKAKAQGAEIYFVASNHNEHLDRWLSEGRYLKDPYNFKIGNQLAAAKVDSLEPAFNAWMRQEVGEDGFTYLTRDDDVVMAGIKLDQHGDIGQNGSRGSLKQFNTACHGTITGHTHTPAISGDAYQVGTSTVLKMHYTKGMSSWLNTHALVWPNGQVQLINIIKGKWRGWA